MSTKTLVLVGLAVAAYLWWINDGKRKAQILQTSQTNAAPDDGFYDRGGT